MVTVGYLVPRVVHPAERLQRLPRWRRRIGFTQASVRLAWSPRLKATEVLNRLSLTA